MRGVSPAARCSGGLARPPPSFGRAAPPLVPSAPDDIDPIENVDSWDSVALPPAPRFLTSLASAGPRLTAPRPVPAAESPEPIDSDHPFDDRPPPDPDPEPEGEPEAIASDSEPISSDAEAVDSASDAPESEPISEANADASPRDDEAIDSSNTGDFFREKRVVFSLLGDDPLELWDCGYTRVLRVAVVESEIEGFTDEVYRLIVRARAVAHVREEGDRFVMGEPFHAFSHSGGVCLLAPNVSDKC